MGLAGFLPLNIILCIDNCNKLHKLKSNSRHEIDLL